MDEIHIEDIKEILKLIDKQANDDKLWFRAKHISEAYLQSALRELHQIVEDKLGIDNVN